MPRSADRAVAAFKHLKREDAAPRLDLGRDLGGLARLQVDRNGELAVGAAHHLDQVVPGDRIAGLAVEDVVDTRLCLQFVAQSAGRTGADR